jgi:mannosyltransferase OCH1-like enzyme
MNTRILFIAIVCIVGMVIGWMYKSIWNAKQLLYEHIKENQIIKSTYNPPSSPPLSIIPKKLFQTWHTKKLLPKMNEAVVRIQTQNPELEYFLFDEDECIAFITQYFSDDVVGAYKKLIPGAFKADLWRYCVMYIHGGVYVDIKYQCVDGFKFIDIMDREHFVLERQYSWKPNTHGIYNALIIAKPGNTLFIKCIEQIVRNTQTYTYGFNELYPTGPGLLGELYFGNINENIEKPLDLQLFYNFTQNQDIIMYKNQIILKAYPEYRAEQKQQQMSRHYTQLWYERGIYI